MRPFSVSDDWAAVVNAVQLDVAPHPRSSGVAAVLDEVVQHLWQDP